MQKYDLVKLIFQVGEDIERMWVIITDQQDSSEWTGVIDNDPFGEDITNILSAGTEVKFHPLDIIQIFEDNKRDENKKYLKEKYNIG